MYSWEITKILETNNLNIDSKTYMMICNTSTQIVQVKYNPYKNNFEMWDNQNNYWNFTIYRKES